MSLRHTQQNQMKNAQKEFRLRRKGGKKKRPVSQIHVPSEVSLYALRGEERIEIKEETRQQEERSRGRSCAGTGDTQE